MRKRRLSLPTLDSFEDHLQLLADVNDSELPDESQQLSTAAADFKSQTGRVLTAVQVFQAHLSRSGIAAIIANQIRGAYSAYKTGLNTALSDPATYGDGNAFDDEITTLCSGLAGRYGETLSTSPSAANFLVPFCVDAINRSGSNSLTSLLATLPIDPSNTAVSQSDLGGAVNASLPARLSALGTFARRPDFQFFGSIPGGRLPTPTPSPTRPAPPTTLSARASPSRPLAPT